MPQRIYVEARIRASMRALWEATQDPMAHASWDLRFTGVGISLGERHCPDGSCERRGGCSRRCR
ncbi:hypothetical protein SAMN05216410_0979 [Sanguibacter gelidistatuariae]|uniref:Polyketide cyclase / dehydrase and lipid transport n=1 Tax=Sanguibacter gelidistatuariae TaxID=1814289 RepID=A0A1G6HF99_9MICO|nr:hypothetical protein [Sanguibacter gelidistatuariae]SDB92901.1 hypothetical protein SAMN05216410_0979 [Sanguibacter gelidistatuariae]